jgi:murein DD-endopeptidase MepM/ murein hydrolase activator NlpD
VPSTTATVNEAGLSTVAQAAMAAGFTGQGLITAVAVAGAESGFGANPGPSPTGDYGDWQINHQAHPQYDTTRLLSDPLYNAQAAYAVSGGGANWSPWTTYTSGAYQQFLPAAEAAVSGLASAAQTVVNYVFPLASGSYTETQSYHDPSTGGTHPGVDLAAPAGTPIYAAAAGTIKSVGGDPTGFGNDYPVEQLADGTTLTYGHAEKSLVTAGQSVSPGQIIALVGTEGDSTGDHLHFQVNLPNGQTTDPLAWLQAHAAASDTTAQLAALAGGGGGSGTITAQTAAFNPLSSADWKSLLADAFIIVMKGVVVLAGASMVVLGVASTTGHGAKLPSIIPIPI